jgi:hypothetical protein
VKKFVVVICAAIAACAPVEPSEIVVKSVELRDFNLATSTILADGNFGQALLVVTDPHDIEHEIPVDVRGGSPWKLGHEVVLGVEHMAATIDIDDVKEPITADALFGPFYGVRADHALGAALELGWYTDFHGVDLLFAVWGAGAGILYGFDIINFKPVRDGPPTHLLKVGDYELASPWTPP